MNSVDAALGWVCLVAGAICVGKGITEQSLMGIIAGAVCFAVGELFFLRHIRKEGP